MGVTDRHPLPLTTVVRWVGGRRAVDSHSRGMRACGGFSFQTRKERRQTAKRRIFQPRRKGSCANGCYSLSGGITMKLRIATASLLIALATAACGSNPVAPHARKGAPTAPAKDNGTGNWMGSGY